MQSSGKVIKIFSHFFYVMDSNGKTWECFARKRLQKEGKKIYVGDNLEFETSNETQGVIIKLEERENKIEKPPAANINNILIVFSTLNPDLDFYNLDRYLSYVSYECPKVEVTICINKIDLKDININDIYKNAGYKIFYVSALKKSGLEELKNNFSNKTTVLTGPSGVGKSSLLKALNPDLEIKIGDLSAIKQGKHTTRNVELIYVETSVGDGYVFDTPGFSQINFSNLDPYKILNTFQELVGLNCDFTNCLHTNEEGCVLNNPDFRKTIPQPRLESYLKILEEVQSEVIYDEKFEDSIKMAGGKGIPKIKKENRAGSRKREKQKLGNQELDEWES